MRPYSIESQNYVSLFNNQSLSKEKQSIDNTISSKIKTTSSFFNVFQSGKQKQQLKPSQLRQNFYTNNNKTNYQNLQTNTQNSSITNSIKNLRAIQQKLNTKNSTNSANNHFRQSTQSIHSNYNFSPFYGRSKSNQAHLLDSDEKKQIKKQKTKIAQLQSTVVNLRFKNQHLKNKFVQIQNQLRQKDKIIEFQLQKINNEKQKKITVLNASNDEDGKIRKSLTSQENEFYRQLQQKNFILQDTNNQLSRKIQWLNDILSRQKIQLEELSKQIRRRTQQSTVKQQNYQKQIGKLENNNQELTREKQHYINLIGDMQNRIGSLNQINSQMTKQNKLFVQQLQEKLRIKQDQLNQLTLDRQRQANLIKKQNLEQVQNVKLQTVKKQASADKSHLLLVERESLLSERLALCDNEIQGLKKILSQRQVQYSNFIRQSSEQKIFMLEQYKILQQQFTSSTLYFKNKVSSVQKLNQNLALQVKQQKFNIQNGRRLFQNRIIYQLKKENDCLRQQNMYYHCGYSDKQISFYRKNYATSMQKKMRSDSRDLSNKFKKSQVVSGIKESKLSTNNYQKRKIKYQAFRNKVKNQQKQLNYYQNNHKNNDQPNIQSSRERYFDLNQFEDISNNIVPVLLTNNSFENQNKNKMQESQGSQFTPSNFEKKQKIIQQRYYQFMKLLKNKFGIGKDHQI